GALADDLDRYLSDKPLVDAYRTSATIKIGLVFSLSGPMAINSQPLADIFHWAVNEINNQGGLLGRAVQPLLSDCRSDEQVYAREVERLIIEERVCTLFGCWSSASRKAALPVVEKYKNLLVYPVEFEGLESSNHIIYLGGVPNQLVIPA